MSEMNHEASSSGPLDDGDELLTRLKAANPVPASTYGDASWSGADTLFDRITSRSGGYAPYSDAAEASADSTNASARSERGVFGQRSVFLAAVAALAVLLVGAAVVLIPSGAQPALAVVQTAASDTADARSGRVVTEFDVVGHEDAEEGTLSGTMTAAFDDENLMVGIEIDPSSDVMSAQEAAQIARAETRLVDGQLYATADGEQWMSIEAPEILQSSLARLTDLRTILAEVEELAEVEVIGPAEIDGVAVTHYRSEVDLADETLAESGWLPGTQGMGAAPVDIDTQGLVTVDLYVDDSGLMRRIEVSGEAEPTDQSIDASADFTVTTNFVDLDTDITIEAPDPALVNALDFDADSLDGGLNGLDGVDD